MKKNKLYQKKGNISASVGSIIALITGVGIAVLVLIFVGVLGGQTYNLVEDNIQEIGNTTASAASVTASSEAANSLGHQFVHSGSLIVYNSSTTIANTNFTIDYTAGTLQLAAAGDVGLNNSVLNANYTWGDLTVQTSVKDGITSGFQALEQTGDYLPIIVLAVVIALVLALVLGMAGMGGKGMNTSAL